MSFNIIDKRTVTNDRSAENRQRLLKRIQGAIKEQMHDLIAGKKLKDMDSGGGEIKIKKKSIREPEFRFGDGGDIDRVLPGNKEYVPGDLIRRPNGGGSGQGGRKGTKDGKTEDDFVIELSRDEFLKYLFEDLELPDMLVTDLKKMTQVSRQNNGFSSDGSPNRLSIVRSYRQSLARRIPIRKRLEKELAAKKLELEALGVREDSDGDLQEIILTVQYEIFLLEQKLQKIPLFDDIDLRYRASIKKEIPVTTATMVMIMDNSGSMGQKEKTIARKFFWLLYSFLKQEYEKIELVFISHTTDAHEMDEEEFFNTHESGGTVVSSALDLTSSIIKERLVGKTNIYIAQVSDGDNYDEDNGTCSEILRDEILPFARYMAYIQVDRYHQEEESNSGFNHINGLWRTYKDVAEAHTNLQLARVMEERDIYGVFYELLKKKKYK